MTKTILTIALLLAMSLDMHLKASTPEIIIKIYNAYINNRMDIWESAIQEMKNRKDKSNFTELYNLSMGYYGYIAYLIGTSQNKKARLCLDEAFNILAKMKKFNPDNSVVHSFEAAFIAYRIALDNYKAVYLGPKSLYHIDRSVELDRNNPLAWLQKGNALYYMPEVMGGSKKEALLFYQKAVELMEKNQKNLNNNWLYLNILTTLALGYEDTLQPEKAMLTYKKILQIEPGFKWVRDELYPNFLKKSQI